MNTEHISVLILGFTGFMVTVMAILVAVVWVYRKTSNYLKRKAKMSFDGVLGAYRVEPLDSETKKQLLNGRWL